jgi:predicted nucleic acid-binding protein
MFLRVAYAAKVDAIVTGDNDLLALASESRIPILHRVSWLRASKSDGVAGIDP